jgi:hypothetical protein
MVKKNKRQPLHVSQVLQEYKLPNGTKFYAKNDKDALLYARKVGGGYARIGNDGKYFHSKGDEYDIS